MNTLSKIDSDDSTQSTGPAADVSVRRAASFPASSPLLVSECPAFVIARPDLADAAAARLRAAGWSEVEIVPAQQRRDHAAGCCAGHAAALERGMAAGRYPFFVFEDDAWPTRWLRAMEVPSGVDFIRLDLSVCGWDTEKHTWDNAVKWDEMGDGWVRLRNMLGSAAAGVCHEGMAQTYMNAAREGEARSVPIDVYLAGLGEEFVIAGLRQPLFYQGPEVNYNAAATNSELTDDPGKHEPAAGRSPACVASNIHPVRGAPLPRKVHQIWLGSRKIPDHFLPWMESVRQFAPGWTYRLWRDEDLKDVLDCAILPDVLTDSTANVGLRADGLRYEILRQHGGVYFDCDYEVLRPLDHLLMPGCLHYGDELSGRPAIGFLASPSGFEFWGFLLRRIRRCLQRTPQHWQEVVGLTGPEAFAAALNDWNGAWSGTTLIDDSDKPYATHFAGGDLAAFWQEVVYPYWYEAHTWREFSPERYPAARAAHHWGGSWQ